MGADAASADHPGGRLGLPSSGPGSVAGWGRRLLALVIDWALSMFAVGAFAGQGVFSGDTFVQWTILGVFALEVWLFTSLLGGSAGQLVMRIGVRRTSGQPLDAGRVLLRTLLICLVIPPLIFNHDGQGLHDLATGSIAVRR